MWIVRLALRRPYTFIVMSLLILILGLVAIYRTPVDIFPVVDIPVVSSTLSICIVFVSVMFLTGAAKSLFTPLALAVVFAMWLGTCW